MDLHLFCFTKNLMKPSRFMCYFRMQLIESFLQSFQIKAYIFLIITFKEIFTRERERERFFHFVRVYYEIMYINSFKCVQ